MQRGSYRNCIYITYTYPVRMTIRTEHLQTTFLSACHLPTSQTGLSLKAQDLAVPGAINHRPAVGPYAGAIFDSEHHLLLFSCPFPFVWPSLLMLSLHDILCWGELCLTAKTVSMVGTWVVSGSSRLHGRIHPWYHLWILASSPKAAI